MAYALITGASKGIGKSLAENLAAKKYDILLVARSEDLLKQNAYEIEKKYGVKTAFFATDISSPDAAKKITLWCTEKNFDVSILVNNAGYGLGGAFSKLSLEEQLNMMQLNMQSLVQLTYMMIPVLKKSGKKSYILNVASTAAHQAVPFLGVYSGTKAFVLNFSRAIHHELKEDNISVTCLCPGPTDTNFMNRAGMNGFKKAVKQAERFNMTPESVAEIGIKALFKGTPEIIPGGVNKAGAFFSRALPKNLTEKTLVGIYKP
ncbi:MAG TPA: SDR family oxidoreductase [Bacteroidia bacterium]|jgi:short-subunit dehydrogenase|nr:SDR family oxidoreductase [Bacteroidia bacterium]